MAKLIPALNDCYSSITSGEQKVAEALEHHLNKDCLIWINPQIPPENLEPDFIGLDPGRGLMSMFSKLTCNYLLLIRLNQ